MTGGERPGRGRPTAWPWRGVAEATRKDVRGRGPGLTGRGLEGAWPGLWGVKTGRGYDG